MNVQTTIHFIAVAVLPLLFGITVHEVAHGWVASKLGDKTALMMGRLTLNPAKHIDLIGTIIVPLVLIFLGGFIFGWAKPVPVTWQNLRKPRRDMALVALAGPFANLLMAIIWGGIAKLCFLGLNAGVSNQWLKLVLVFFMTAGAYGILINCLLMILNLLPIPPLDGSRVVSSLLPPRWSAKYDRIEPYGFFILLGLLFFGVLQYLIGPPIFAMVALIKAWLGLG